MWGSLGVNDLALAPIGEADTRLLADIHAATFARPWTDGEFDALLTRPTNDGFILRLPKSRGGKPVGFVLTRTVIDEVEILTIAVQPNWQALGAGRRLMDAALGAAHAARAKSVFLEVDEHNHAALALYRRLGFSQVGRRDGYYALSGGAGGNALVMRRDIA